MTLTDSFNRAIDYLRISVTDRCNFRCVYCMPDEGAPVAPREDLLSADSLERISRVAVELGFTKIRLTGGEPLVRPDIADIVSRVGSISGLRDLSITTNGYLLERYASSFAASGLDRVNISLDTLRPERFASIARRGSLDRVMAGIAAARSAGLTPIKLNCVVMNGWNADEAIDFACLTLGQDIDVRFIELMPINWAAGDDSAPRPSNGGSEVIHLFANIDRASFQSVVTVPDLPARGQLNAAQMHSAYVPSEQTRSSIESKFGALEPAQVQANGPARSFRVPGAKGTISFISQISNDMCARCNRLRVTADGCIRPCLMADGEISLRAALASADNDLLEECFRLSVLHKPYEHRLEDGIAPVSRNMSQIGG